MQDLKVNLYPVSEIEVNGVGVLYGRIPNGIIEGFEDIIFYFLTAEAFDTEKHEKTVKPLLDSIEHDSHDHGAYWELTKCECLVWNERSQVTVASFRVRDSY
jgi:hypothetical protein